MKRAQPLLPRSQRSKKREGVSSNEEIRHNCGIGAVFALKSNVEVVSHMTALLYTLQSRGREGAGIAMRSQRRWHTHKGKGLVSHIFSLRTIKDLSVHKPSIAIGQTRYSTSGEGDSAWQPFQHMDTVLVHNGTLTNAQRLLEKLPKNIHRYAVSDSWIALETIMYAPGTTFEQKLIHAQGTFEGSYNFIVGHGDTIYALRDTKSFRPLGIGKLPDGAGYVVASEDSAMRPIHARFDREIKPGEIVRIDKRGIKTIHTDTRTNPKKFTACMLELLYFASPDSTVFGVEITKLRQRLGAMLAEEDIKKGFLPDAIVPVQESGVIYSQGYFMRMVQELMNNPGSFGLKKGGEITKILTNLVPQTGLVKNNDMGRVFISNGGREWLTSLKHRGNPQVVKGKHVVLLDDSLIRGNAAIGTGISLRSAGAVGVHYRIAAPPVIASCFWGMDFPTRKELIAHTARGNVAKVRLLIGAKSLRYLSHLQLLEAVTGRSIPDRGKRFDYYGESGFCGHCFTAIAPERVRGVFAKQ